MKKVICVDAKFSPTLTQGKRYNVLSQTETAYEVINDDNVENWYTKSIFKDTDTAPTFTYGQEVEVSMDDKHWYRQIYVGENPVKENKYRHIVVNDQGHIDSTYYCRPIQSLKQQILELVKDEQLADKIIEIVKEK